MARTRRLAVLLICGTASFVLRTSIPSRHAMVVAAKGKKGKKGKGKGNGKKPHIKTIDGVNPGGWLDGAQGSWEWDEDLQAIDDVTGDYVHDPFIDDVTGDYVAPPDDSD
mgnify:CR=1 FL=1